MPTPTSEPTPEALSAAMSSENPILSMLGMIPDEQLTALQVEVERECERRGITAN